MFILPFSSDAHGANRRARRSLVPRTTIRLDIVGRLMAGSHYRRSRSYNRKREALCHDLVKIYVIESEADFVMTPSLTMK